MKRRSKGILAEAFIKTKTLADIEDSKEASLAAWKIPDKTNVWKMSSQNKIIMHKR